MVAGAPKGAVFRVAASFNTHFRVVLPGERHAWVAEGETTPGGLGKATHVMSMIHPPKIHLDGKAVRATTASDAAVKGWVEHTDGVMDLIVFVGDDKVAYLPNRRGGAAGDRFDFDLKVPLKEGANRVILMARPGGSGERLLSETMVRYSR